MQTLMLATLITAVALVIMFYLSLLLGVTALLLHELISIFYTFMLGLIWLLNGLSVAINALTSWLNKHNPRYKQA